MSRRRILNEYESGNLLLLLFFIELNLLYKDFIIKHQLLFPTIVSP